jgi:hypothetical protein
MVHMGWYGPLCKIQWCTGVVAEITEELSSTSCVTVKPPFSIPMMNARDSEFIKTHDCTLIFPAWYITVITTMECAPFTSAICLSNLKYYWKNVQQGFSGNHINYQPLKQDYWDRYKPRVGQST